MRNDLNAVTQSNTALRTAVKICNLYKMPKEEHEKLLRNAITSTYKKASENIMKNEDTEWKNEITTLWIEYTSNGERFFTMKDHKESFMNNPTICLINPTKSELGLISKEILDKINNN